jgi:hypothetical protein
LITDNVATKKLFWFKYVIHLVIKIGDTFQVHFSC